MPSAPRRKKIRASNPTQRRRLLFNSESSELTKLKSMMQKALATKKLLMSIQDGLQEVITEAMTHASQLTTKIDSCNEILHEINYLTGLQEFLDDC